MPEMLITKSSPLRIRQRGICNDEQKNPVVVWPESPKKQWGDALGKNIAVSAALVLCAITLRTGAVPRLRDATDAVMTAVTDQSLLDEQLGKLSFVSALFPEAVLVFGEQDDLKLTMPESSGEVVHAWSAAEPYLALRTTSDQVTSACAGEVIGVYHGNGEEKLVQVLSIDGTSCLYGNLEQVEVKLGDAVSAGSILGRLLTGADYVLEVRRDGVSIDPSLLMTQ